MCDILPTPRKSMKTLQGMNDYDFLIFAQDLVTFHHGYMHDMKLSLKVDGIGARLGKDSTGHPFFETSRSGPIQEPGSFTRYNQEQGVTDPIRLQRAIWYDELYDYLFAQDVYDAIPMDVKILCELLYIPMGTLTSRGIQFVNTPYDPERLGKMLTITPYGVVNSTTGNTHPMESSIISHMMYAFCYSEEIKIIPSEIFTPNPIYLGDVLEPILYIDPRVVKSRKHRDRDIRAKVQGLIQETKEALARHIWVYPGVQGLDRLGPEVEALVITLNNTPYKIRPPHETL